MTWPICYSCPAQLRRRGPESSRHSMPAWRHRQWRHRQTTAARAWECCSASWVDSWCLGILKVAVSCSGANNVSRLITSLLNWTACADFSNVVAERHILGVRTQGAITPKFELGVSAEIFVQYTYPQVSLFYVYSFGSYRVDITNLTHPQTNKQTNKQTPLKTSNVLRYATTLGKNLSL